MKVREVKKMGWRGLKEEYGIRGVVRVFFFPEGDGIRIFPLFRWTGVVFKGTSRTPPHRGGGGLERKPVL